MNRFGVSALVLVVGSHSAFAEPYQYELFVVRDFSPDPLATDTALTGLNNNGTVVGWSRFNDKPTRRGF